MTPISWGRWPRPTRRSVALVTCGALAAAGLSAAGAAMLQPQSATASSHREAPLISGQPQFDNTDVYAFVSPDHPDTTTIVANWLPFQEPAGGPNFFPFAGDARYSIHVDSDGDAQDDLLYRYTFKDHRKNENTFLHNTGVVESLDDPDLNFTQTYDIELLRLEHGKEVSSHQLAKQLPTAPANVGKASMPDYQKLRDQAVHKIPGGLKTFAGQADDPFFLDLRVFDLLYGGDLSEVGNDTLRGYNVNTIALQVPNAFLRESEAQPVIGIYSTTERQNAEGHWTQVSRLGMPLVNEVVNPVKDKDKFNASSPENDGDFLKNVTEPELPKLIEAIYKIKAPAEPRQDLVSVFLTGIKDVNQPPGGTPSEMLRLNTAVKPTGEPKRLGVLDGDNAGFPNGRRLTDDVLDIALQVVEGELVGSENDLGDAVDANDKEFGHSFPYVALPASGSDTRTAADAKTKSATGLTGGASGLTGSWSDSTVLAAGGAGALLVAGFGAFWLRSRRRTARRSWLG
ncbi:DUF4331 domain-containing protein [Streptomyces sp. PKU-EA00015]|uniref:DUF4331 domain-containing protein n=1 Tax=Streptomyces sp. PKU-EA00015 TaxID=2748326 RepID=UPI0015A4C2EC|nr:DUF4331 domain-containing protein [Streptomyces sp. PKU-EA00015]NWF29490.1 DUF4331 domain-containing protein [Streptomyces sp. PKU-EA00015]